MKQRYERGRGGSGGGSGFIPLEKKTYKGIRLEELFEPEDGFRLMRGTSRGENVVQILTPRYEIYKLGTYKTPAQAEKAFKKFDALLSKHYKLRVKNQRDNGGYKAKVEIVPP